MVPFPTWKSNPLPLPHRIADISHIGPFYTVSLIYLPKQLINEKKVKLWKFFVLRSVSLAWNEPREEENTMWYNLLECGSFGRFGTKTHQGSFDINKWKLLLPVMWSNLFGIQDLWLVYATMPPLVISCNLVVTIKVHELFQQNWIDHGKKFSTFPLSNWPKTIVEEVPNIWVRHIS